MSLKAVCLSIGGILLVSIVVSITPHNAVASELVDRNASKVRLSVTRNNVALVTYRTNGRSRRAAFWGAVDRSALRFKRRRTDLRGVAVAGSGGRANTCRRYSGPTLPWVVAACTNIDGSHWVLQSWTRSKRNYGGSVGDRDLRISHFTGQPTELRAWTDWADKGTRVHLYGTLRFHGEAIGARRFSSTGRVLDKYGRNVAIDSLNSDMGRGWRRVNAILAHKPSGQFCYTFGPKAGATRKTGASRSLRYRISVPGPYVAPDTTLVVVGVRLRSYSARLDAPHNRAQRALVGSYAGAHSCQNID
jgi:type IV secretory pathway VirB3-like protein